MATKFETKSAIIRFVYYQYYQYQLLNCPSDITLFPRETPCPDITYFLPYLQFFQNFVSRKANVHFGVGLCAQVLVFSDVVVKRQI